jgi:hypothetical protein
LGLGEVLTTPLRKKRMLRITYLEMLPLEAKQTGGKLLHHSDLRGGGGFLEEVSRSRKSFFLAGTCGYGEELSSFINAENFLTSGKVYC